MKGITQGLVGILIVTAMLLAAVLFLIALTNEQRGVIEGLEGQATESALREGYLLNIADMREQLMGRLPGDG